jgi:AcrR family transcriptional regulator
MLWLLPERAERGPALTRSAIVATAIELADAEGMDAVSIRRVAAELGVRPMSLYTHISRKQDLLDLMLDAVAGDAVVGGELPADWREALRQIAWQTRDATLRHPWVMSMAGGRTAIGPNALRHVDQSLAAVAGLAVDRDRKIAILVAVDTYTIGQAARELAGREALRHAGVSNGAWREATESYLARMIEMGRYRHLAEFGAAAFIDAHEVVERRFTEGLDWLIDGIAASLSDKPTPSER